MSRLSGVVQQTKAEPTPDKVDVAPPAPIVAQVVGCEEYQPIVAQYDWNVSTALAVMKAESGCNTTAFNTNTDGSTDQGLMQINSVHCIDLIPCGERTNATLNIQAAYAIYRGSGWRAWSVCHSKLTCY